MTPPISHPPPPAPETRLHAAAEQLETAFLAEMLRSAGLGRTAAAFGGGPGEEQFTSFLVESQAAEIVRAGGIGLAQSIFESLAAGSDDR